MIADEPDRASLDALCWGIAVLACAALTNFAACPCLNTARVQQCNGRIHGIGGHDSHHPDAHVEGPFELAARDTALVADEIEDR